jgi:carbon monoxide dehydrogenase subunit G
MATNRREHPLNVPADKVWEAVRDFGQVHTRVAPGFLTGLELDKGDRVITFFNGLVARERLVTVDDSAMRLVYTVVGGRPSHYNGAIQVIADGASTCRLVWTIDLLPDDLRPIVGGMMDHAAPFMKQTLEAT